MGCFRFSSLTALIGTFLVSPTATSVAAVAVAPQASSNGLCYRYVVQAGESCSVIAQAHSITMANIETYNARSWAWHGCGQISQGSFICLSAGEPPMPVALPNAVCGPQVPGTTRPNSWSDLGSLNPCAANECCSSWGLCGTTSDFCTSAHATTALSISTGTHPNKWTTTSKKSTTSTGTTKSIQKLAASSETSSTSKTTSTSATKSVPTATSTTTTTRTTSTKATTTKSTKSSQTKPSTSTKPASVSPWSLTMYSKKDCTGDYYVLQGHNAGYSNTCLNLHGGLSSQYTDTGVSCKWFTNGGDSNTKCDAGTLEAPQSWVVLAGICTVYDVKNCNHSDGFANAYTPVLEKPCQNRAKFDTPKFLSMNCYTEGSG